MDYASKLSTGSGQARDITILILLEFSSHRCLSYMASELKDWILIDIVDLFELRLGGTG